jgi:heme-degrading monooxygenase HmoA
MTVAVVFTSRRTPQHDAEYGEMSDAMVELVQQQPGFIRMASVRDPRTREGITVAWFEDEESVRAWKSHPEHAEAQRRGIEDFYEDYHVTVARVEREYGMRP